MRIKNYFVFLSCLIVSTIAADEKHIKKKDDRGKRNIDYQTSHHYINPSTYRLERRISTAFQGPQNPAQYYPHPHRKGRPQSYHVPPYAVQMEPLIHYSQRDPLYDTNLLSLDKHNNNLLTENNYIHQGEAERRGFIRYKTKIIEKPVYIKEPEPIIEIIIKESNVSLPAPPPPPPPPKKKKEQVQVFFVKYKKNPNGEYGKDSIIYDKPIPAISPKLPEDDHAEEEEAPYNYHPETATVPPPPSTTLRTVIKPDSEVYHSPSGIKVTFGKEGFDYEKRSSKPEDFPSVQQQPQGRQLNSAQQPTGRQLSSFSNNYFKSPSSTSQSFQSAAGLHSESRPRQPYRPISFPSAHSSQTSYKPLVRPTNPQFPPKPSVPPQKFSHPTAVVPQKFPSPPTTGFQNLITTPVVRQPVPYRPFENFRPQQDLSQSNRINWYRQQQIQFRPETHYSNQQLPQVQKDNKFAPGLNPQQHSRPQDIPGLSPQFSRQQESTGSFHQQQFSRPHESGGTIQPAQSHFDRPTQNIHPHGNSPIQQPFQKPSNQHSFQNNPTQQSFQNPPNFPAVSFNQQSHLQQQSSLPLAQPPKNFFQPNNFNQQPIQHQQENLQYPQTFIPPGGELIQSLPKYETHISSLEHPAIGPAQNLQQQHYQEKTLEHFNSREQNSKEITINPQNNFADQSRYQSDQQKQDIHQEQQQRQREQQRQHDQQQFYLHNGGGRQNNNQQGVVLSNTTPSTIYHTRQSQFSNTSPNAYNQHSTDRSTTTTTTTTTTEAATPSTTTKDPKILEAQLPDEVPPELREQLLSSGILNNADISILDYDKVGDIPLSALPPDQLANFFNAGGAEQIAGSEHVSKIVDTNGQPIISDKLSVDESDPLEPESEASEIEEVKVSPPFQGAESKNTQSAVDFKVVQYDPETDKGKQIQEAYISGEEAKQISPVILNDESYTRYLPLKVNGTQFPIPDVPELKGKKISSVVVLAPVSYDFSTERKTRQTAAQGKSSEIDFIEGTTLKQLLDNPTLDNYNEFLDNENKTKTDKQSVILLVTQQEDASGKDKEIFMYDVATKTVSKLSGELSSAFVEAAEANSNDETAASETTIIESRVPYPETLIDRKDDLDSAGSSYTEHKISANEDEDMDLEETKEFEKIVDINGKDIKRLSSLKIQS